MEDKFTKSIWLCDVSIRIRESSEIVTNSWLEAQFRDSLQNDDAVPDGRMERFLAYLVHEESLKPWWGEHYVNDLYAADLKLGCHRDMTKVWSVRDEDPMEAAATIVAVER